MGCGCGGGRRSALGVTPAQPIIFGDDAPDLPTRRVVVVQASAGVPAGSSRYVRGSDVDTMIINGQLRILES